MDNQDTVENICHIRQARVAEVVSLKYATFSEVRTRGGEVTLNPTNAVTG